MYILSRSGNPALSVTALLKRHPFPVSAHFDRAVALSFAFPEAVVRPLVPAVLSLDTHDGLAFVTVAMVWTRALRPTGVPRFLGQDFFLAGYRVFVRFTEPSGRRLRGLNIVRSDTDQSRMVWAGNLLTHYQYHRVDVHVQQTGSATQVQTVDASGAITLDLSLDLPDPTDPDAAARDAHVPLPAGSPFADWTEARRFAGPMPFTFSAEDDGTMVIVEGRRQHWEPRPIVVNAWRVALFDELPLRAATPVLANAFVVHDVAYTWKRGRVVNTTAGEP